MAKYPYRVRRAETAWPDDHRVERHIASGSGWEQPGTDRGGGSVPARNPWRSHGTFDNPAQLGIGKLGKPIPPTNR